MTKLEPADFYYEGRAMVFTAAYHLKRGYCCSFGCRHCPWRDVAPMAEGEPEEVAKSMHGEGSRDT